MRIILLGPPGAGKGTQAILMSQKYSIPHISTGEIMRSAVSSNSSLGKEVKQYLDQGNLVPDDLVNKLVAERLAQADCNNGFILDGFPRTVAQADELSLILDKLKLKLDAVLQISLAQDVLIERIQKRGAMGSGRTDDTAETAIKRLSVYMEKTAPLIGHYKSTNLLKVVDGLGTIEQVQDRISKSLGNI